jgi:hypothetical protein
LIRIEERCTIQARRKDILLSRISLWLTIVVISFIKQQTIRKDENMIIYSVYKKNHPVTPSKQVVNVVNLGYLGVEKDYPVEQLSALPYKRRESMSCYKKKKSVTKSILKRGT